MFASGEKIDYNLRPAKQIERKMLCETFRRLSPFGSVESYRYVGFGSFYFADFVLIHKLLGIADMISVEAEENKDNRFRFNKPFGCVRLVFGHSNDVLPQLPWKNRRTILWLDYDYKLNDSCLEDVSFFCRNAVSGSVLVITVDAQSEAKPAVLLDSFRETIDTDRLPFGLTAKDLTGWGTARVSHRIVRNEIQAVLKERNALLDQKEMVSFRQLFNFHYSDSARMLTVGGVIHNRADEEKFKKCGFGALKFIRSGVNPYHIELPRLTYREIRHLDSQLPRAYGQLRSKGIKKEELRKYAQVYRWFPSFAEVEM